MADIERLPCGVEHELRADAAIIRSWIDVANGPINREALADRLDRYANAAAELTAEIEALRAEVAEAREFRDKLAKAIGNEQLRMFIEKHGEPVPLTLRVQAAEARAERLVEALKEIRSRSSIDFAMNPNPYELTALLGDIHQIAGAALAQEAHNG